VENAGFFHYKYVLGRAFAVGASVAELSDQPALASKVVSSIPTLDSRHPREKIISKVMGFFRVLWFFLPLGVLKNLQKEWSVQIGKKDIPPGGRLVSSPCSRAGKHSLKSLRVSLPTYL
jgi:hypothetical protein